MPSDRTITIRPGAIYEDPDDWAIVPPPIYTGGNISVNIPPITLASIEDMLGMSSTIDIISNIKTYIMDNLSSFSGGTKSEVESRVDRIIEALGRNNYTPTRRVCRMPPTHIVYLDAKSVEEFINKISKCSYIKWRLASPIYWGVNNIGIEGTFKR